METTQKPNPREQPKEDDVDLGQLYYKTSGIINNFFSWLARVFAGLGDVILQIIFFFRRKMIWLLAGLILGMGYGIYLFSKKGNNYFSEMTVRANFNSTRSIYGSLEYFNALINSGRTEELSKIFNITGAEASSLIRFQASPIITELITADLYKDQFLNLKHNVKLRMDTFWTKTINYPDFKSSLTKFDYPIHLIKVTSSNAFIFPKIQQGLIAQISNIDLLKQVKANGDESNKQEVNLLLSSIQSLDTLRINYNKRLSSGTNQNELGYNLTMLDANVKVNSAELELYDKMLQLKDELKMAKDQALMEKNIIQVYSPFGSIGQKESFLEQKIVRYSLNGLLTALIVTGIIGLYNLLINLEKSYTKNKVLRKGN